MAVESSDDLAAFLDPDEFGVAATYTPGVGSPSTVNGIFDREYVEILDNDADAGVSGYKPTFLCRSSDVSSAAYGDGVTIAGTDYVVIDIEPSSDGAMTKLILNEA